MSGNLEKIVEPLHIPLFQLWGHDLIRKHVFIDFLKTIDSKNELTLTLKQHVLSSTFYFQIFFSSQTQERAWPQSIGF